MNKSASGAKGKNGRGRTVSPLLVYRIAAGLSQRELATLAGVVPATVGNAERGTHRPRGVTASALARALGVEVEELFP